MSQTKSIVVVTFILVVGAATLSQSLALPLAGDTGIAPEAISQLAAGLISDAIPRNYERSKDWGRTRKITTGVRSSGNFFKFDIHRKKEEVNHGVWKKYRVTLVEPEQNLEVRIENLRTLDSGRFALTLFVTAKLHGWARTKVYENGVHIVSLEAEGDSTVRLWLDAEIGVESAGDSMLLRGIAIRPVIIDARLKLDDFRLTRISDMHGPLVRELGEGISHLIEDELSGQNLATKINRSIEKRRDQLEFTPDRLLGAR